MPTYEYACKTCGEHVEVVQSFKDGPLTECPACGGPLRKVFGNIGIAFKGSGFYKTDSRSAATAGKSAAAGGSDKSSSSSSSDGGSSGGSGGSGGSESGGSSPAKSDGAAAGSAPAKPAPVKPASSAAS